METIEFLSVACDQCGRRVARDPRTWSDSVPEVAAQIGLSRRATYRLIESGHLRSYQAGGARRILHADVVVKIVMLGLLAASVWTWAIIFTHAIRLKRINKATEKFEADFWAADDIDAFHAKRGTEKLPSAAILSAGMDEWRRSTRSRTIDRSGTRERLATRMNAAVAAELDRLGDRLNILATVGSVAPFVGLFGTVWGIMRSFTSIAAQNNTSLAVVAPGIAEALFATAIGLFAAIPAGVAPTAPP